MSAGVIASAERAGQGKMELARMLATLAWILGATVAGIAALGTVPAWLEGESAHVRTAATIQEAERRLGARILVPGYFPQRLEWPPERIRVAGGRRGSVRVTVAARDGGPGLEILQATREGEAIAPVLLEGRTVLRSGPTTVGVVPARISDVLVDGHPAHELAWELRGRAMLLRSAGDVDELFRMAKSAHREGGR
jgi:hypothetical protein